MAKPFAFVVLRGSPADYEGPVRARKAHPCEHRSAHCRDLPVDVACPGPVQPGELYLRVRMGSWLEYGPVRAECLAAAGVIRVVASSAT